MQEVQVIREQLSAAFLDAYLRFQRLSEELKHSPGTIVWKGSQKQYSYWQFYEQGKQVQKYVHKSGLEAVRSRIERMKAQHRKRMVLRKFFSDLKRALRAMKVSWQEIIDQYEEARKRRESEAAFRAAAKICAESKRYADQYKHMTDRGDRVASKSELLIANMLFARKIPYEYEVDVVAGGLTYKADFVVWDREGKKYYWEHAGMMDDPQYEKKFRNKLRAYELVNIRLQENLIVTRDENGAFSAEEVRRTIEYYKLER